MHKVLRQNSSDYQTDGGGGSPTVNGAKWGTLPGAKLRRPSTGSMTNLANINLMNGSINGGNMRVPPSHRHSVHIDPCSIGGEDELLESLVRTTTQQSMRTNERSRRKARYGDRKSSKIDQFVSDPIHLLT